MDIRASYRANVHDMCEWFGVWSSKSKQSIDGMNVIEERSSHRHATYILRNPAQGLMSSLEINAQKKPYAILEGPTTCLVLNNRIVDEKFERVIFSGANQQANWVIRTMPDKSITPEPVDATLIGNLWNKMHLSIPALISHERPDYEKAERALTRLVVATGYVQRLEEAFQRLHLQL